MNNKRAVGLATYKRTTTQNAGNFIQHQKSSVDDFRDEAIRRQIERRKQAEKEQYMEEYLRYMEKRKKKEQLKKLQEEEEKKMEEESIVVGEPIYASKVIDTKVTGLREGQLIRSQSHENFESMNKNIEFYPQPQDMQGPYDDSSDDEDFFNLKEDEVENKTLFEKFCEAFKDKVKIQK